VLCHKDLKLGLEVWLRTTSLSEKRGEAKEEKVTRSPREVKESLKERVREVEELKITVPIEGGPEYQQAKRRFEITRLIGGFDETNMDFQIKRILEIEKQQREMKSLFSEYKKKDI
jgi:hypothetical protein